MSSYFIFCFHSINVFHHKITGGLKGGGRGYFQVELKTSSSPSPRPPLGPGVTRGQIRELMLVRIVLWGAWIIISGLFGVFLQEADVSHFPQKPWMHHFPAGPSETGSEDSWRLVAPLWFHAGWAFRSVSGVAGCITDGEDVSPSAHHMRRPPAEAHANGSWVTFR